FSSLRRLSARAREGRVLHTFDERALKRRTARTQTVGIAATIRVMRKTSVERFGVSPIVDGGPAAAEPPFLRAPASAFSGDRRSTLGFRRPPFPSFPPPPKSKHAKRSAQSAPEPLALPSESMNPHRRLRPRFNLEICDGR